MHHKLYEIGIIPWHLAYVPVFYNASVSFPFYCFQRSLLMSERVHVNTHLSGRRNHFAALITVLLRKTKGKRIIYVNAQNIVSDKQYVGV